MPTHPADPWRRAGALLLASALVVLSWCATGGASAASAAPATSTSAVASMHGSGTDEVAHAASVDQGSRAGHVQAHHVAPDTVPAPTVVLQAPRATPHRGPAAGRAPPAGVPVATTASRAPPA